MFNEANGVVTVGAVVMPLAVFQELEPGYVAVGVREYTGEDWHCIRANGSQSGGPRPWPEGDAYLANEATYAEALAAQSVAAQEAAASEAQAEYDALPYAEKRARAYPALGDQFDAIWKQFEADVAAGGQLIPDADVMLGKIKAVKAEFPKPEGV